MTTYYQMKKGDLFDLNEKLDKFLKETTVNKLLALEEINEEEIEEIFESVSDERLDFLDQHLEEMEGDKHPEVLQERAEMTEDDLKLAHSLLSRLVEVLGECEIDGSHMTKRELEQIMFEYRHARFETV